MFGHGDLLSAFFTVDLLVNGFPASPDAPRYDGPVHFYYKPSRTEGMQGIWDSAKANMETYQLLADKARAFRADPAVAALMEENLIAQLAVPTLAEGESVADFLATEEEFDADAAGAREYRFVELYQAALRHLIS